MFSGVRFGTPKKSRRLILFNDTFVLLAWRQSDGLERSELCDEHEEDVRVGVPGRGTHRARVTVAGWRCSGARIDTEVTKMSTAAITNIDGRKWMHTEETELGDVKSIQRSRW